MFQMNFELNPKSRTNSLKSIGTKWRNFKHMLINCGKKILGNVEDLEVDQGKKEKERVDSPGNKEVEVVDGGKKENARVDSPGNKKRKRTTKLQDTILVKKQTRAETSTRKLQNSLVLGMTSRMVDTFKNTNNIRVQSEDAAFGGDSYTYISRSDFEVVWSMNRLTGTIIDSYML
jgi:hypothetical protein